MASVECPLLGADFLHHSGLLVDIKGKQLVNADTHTSIPLHVQWGKSVMKLKTLGDSEDCFVRLLTTFPELTTPVFFYS